MADIADRAADIAEQDRERAMTNWRNRAEPPTWPNRPPICQRCGAPISAERLAAVPGAIRCADCQELTEAGR